MNIVIFTHDYFGDNAHLMPWRTVLEVSQHLSRAGHTVSLISLNNFKNQRPVQNCIFNFNVIFLNKNKLINDSVYKLLDRLDPELIYFPFGWWFPKINSSVFANRTARVVAYFPGGKYSLRVVIPSIGCLGLWKVIPYFVQAIFPSFFVKSILEKFRVKDAIAMTAYTKKALVEAGLAADRIHCILPGRDNSHNTNAGVTPVYDSVKALIGSDMYFIFFGPPTAIRGIHVLLRAFQLLELDNKNIHLVCLFRTDKNLDIRAIQGQFESTNRSPNIHFVWASVSKTEMSAFLRGATAAVLPFLLVPSEIPLAFIEAASHGLPVITTGPSGTSEFASGFGLVVPVNNSVALAKAMFQFAANDSLYRVLHKKALLRFASCSDWQEVSMNWFKVGMH